LSSYLVQASPLSKIFMAEWEQRCVEKPELVGESSPGLFKVFVPRACGGLIFEHLKPRHSSTLIPRLQTLPGGKTEVTRKPEDDEITPLVSWLTDARSQETAIYGVVEIDVGSQFEGALQDLLQLTLEGGSAAKQEAALKKQTQIQKKIVSDMSERLIEARALADSRVKAALSITHNNLIKSWESLKGEGKGTYAPSTQEALGYFVLKAEIDKRLEASNRLYNKVAEGMPGAQRNG